MLFLKDTPIDQIVSMDEMILAIEEALKDVLYEDVVDINMTNIKGTIDKVKEQLWSWTKPKDP